MLYLGRGGGVLVGIRGHLRNLLLQIRIDGIRRESVVLCLESASSRDDMSDAGLLSKDVELRHGGIY